MTPASICHLILKIVDDKMFLALIKRYINATYILCINWLKSDTTKGLKHIPLSYITVQELQELTIKHIDG